MTITTDTANPSAANLSVADPANDNDETLTCVSCGTVGFANDFFGNYCIDCEELAGEDDCCVSCGAPLDDDEGDDDLRCDDCSN